ncbi:hypothetical protein C8R44DRAFT_735708 [Mycena epipterygia]|nr:hypothetical protein C8R44DRAFT_735708 [Mycena epipterygia]
MSIRSAYISALPHPGPPPTCPLPSLPTKKANRTSPPVVKLPEGYAFVPPPVPLTYPASYHLIPAGPMNARKPKRVVFRTLTNFAEKCAYEASRGCGGRSVGGGYTNPTTTVGIQMTVLRDAVGKLRYSATRLIHATLRWQGRSHLALGDHSCYRFIRLSTGNRTQSTGSGGLFRHSMRQVLGDHSDILFVGFWGIILTFYSSGSGDHSDILFIGFGGIIMAFFLRLNFGLWGICIALFGLRGQAELPLLIHVQRHILSIYVIIPRWFWGYSVLSCGDIGFWGITAEAKLGASFAFFGYTRPLFPIGS